MNKIRILQGLFVLLGAGFLGVLVFQFVDLKKEQSLEDLDTVVSDQREDLSESLEDENTKVELREFHRVEIKDGKKIWEVHAKDAQLFSEEGATHVSDALLELYRKEGKVSIKAKEAKLVLVSGEMDKVDLEGGVDFQLEDGTKVSAEYATYRTKSGKIEAPGDVRIEGEGYLVSGTGFEMDVEAQKIFFRDNVRSRFTEGGEFFKTLEAKAG